MDHISIAKQTRKRLFQLKKTLEVKHINQVIEWLLTQVEKEQGRESKLLLDEKTPAVEPKITSRTPSLSLREGAKDGQTYAEKICATEELRSAVKSEIRAQEAYENAKREVESTKREVDQVRDELEELKQSVDLLDLKKCVKEQETVGLSNRRSRSGEFKWFKEEVSKRGFERVIGDIVSDIIHKKAVEKVEEGRC